MTLKTKFLMPLFVVLVLGMANSAFAQLSCGVSSTPVSRATSTGHTEQAGDLTFTCVAGPTATTAATVTVAYGVTVTNDATYPAGRPIAITGTSGSFVGAGAPTLSNATISNLTGQVVINVPAQAVPANGTFSLTGVLVSLNGTNFTTLKANISASQGNGVAITSNQDNPTVITSIQPGINTTTAPPNVISNGAAQPALYFGTSATAAVANIPARGAFTINVTENYIDMLREQAQYAGGLNDTQLLFTFAGIPTGATIGGCAATMILAPAGAGTALISLSSATVTPVTTGGLPGPTLTMTINAAQLTNLSQIELVALTCTTYTITLGTTPQPMGTPITATVTLGPTGIPLNATTNAVLIAATTGQIPRYQINAINVGTVLSFTPNTTTMIIPYLLGSPASPAPAGSFDTGIAIANTTGEIVGGTGIFAAGGGAQAQAGTITFNFFPTSGTATDRFSVTTASIASGASYVANVSELLRAAGRTTAFQGYIIAVANFTNAHGMAFLYGGSAVDRITSATDILTIVPPILAGRSLLGGVGVEGTTK